MIHCSRCHAVRCSLLVTLLLRLIPLLGTAGNSFAASVGDQVELKATHQAGVPLHKEPHGTDDFQRVPDGTKATIIEVAPDSRWVKLSLPDGRTGWVSPRYVRGSATSPSTDISPAAKPPQRIEEGIVERVADGDTVTVITPNQTKLRIRMWDIDAPETPKGTTFPGQPYGPEAEAYLKRLVGGKRVRVEIVTFHRILW
jgi:Bacterial SH3 domain/Staphylococcal nuclease homologue